MDITERGALAAIEVLANFKHYGVKGMKWGVRKKSGKPSGPTEVTVTKNKLGGVTVKGGQGYERSAQSVATTKIRQQAKMSGKTSLTNAQLQEAINRMNLEQQFDRLNANQKSKGQKFVEGLLLNAGKQQAQVIVNQEVGKMVGAQMGKRATR